MYIIFAAQRMPQTPSGAWRDEAMKRNISSAPHIRSGNSELLLALDIFIAALPAVIWSAVVYGARPIAVITIAMLCGALFEVIFAVLLRREARIPTAMILGMTVALFMPAGVNYFMIPIVVFIAVLFRRLCGGIINPTAISLVPFIMFTGMMTAHTEVFTKLELGVVSYWDRMNELSAQAPLDELMSGAVPGRSALDVFLGNAPGAIGEMSSALLLLGGIYLICRRTISWQIPVGFIGAAIVCWFFFFFDGVHYEYLVYHISAGGIFLGAFFGAAEHSSTPVTPMGRFIHGAGCGVLTMLFRKLGLAQESVLLSMLIMSLFSRPLDMMTAERFFGCNGKSIGERLAVLLPSRNDDK